MFVLELEFTNDQRRLDARPAHRERLLALRDAERLVMAGPWADDAGALLIFRTDRHGVDEIVADDPYYSTPGVQVKDVREWRPIIEPTQ